MEVYTDEEKNLKGVFYQDEQMQNMFKSYPEIFLVDATYKLNNLRMPLYVFLVVDGNGESEIAALTLVADKSAETVRQMMKSFKKHNTTWGEIKCIMADKDMTERTVLKEELPGAGLLICLFHTMRSFKREMTTS